jgi:hypothetical protein
MPKLDIKGSLRAAAAEYARIKAQTVRDAVAQGDLGVVAAAAGPDSTLYRNARSGTLTGSDIAAWSAARAKQARRRAQQIALRGRAAARAALDAKQH